jgi:hypothetical protein
MAALWAWVGDKVVLVRRGSNERAPARAYLDRRVSEGKTRREAMRALKRFLVRAIWRLWVQCYPTPTPAEAPCPS